MNESLSPEQLAELQGLIARQQKIGAIKRYRDLTGAGLAEAKEAIGLIEAGQTSLPQAVPQALSPDKLTVLRDLLLRNQKVEAIRTYRDYSGAGLADAKAAVEQIESELRTREPHGFATPARKGGCFGLIILVCAAGAGALGLSLWMRAG